MIKNFLFVLKRFKTSSILNITGLSVAFAVFVIIMMQVDYDYNFDRFSPDNEQIYRIDAVINGRKQAVLARPLAEAWFQASPHIVAGAITQPFAGKVSVIVEKNGSKFSSNAECLSVSPDFTKVFPFDMVEGTIAALDEPDMLIIPQSLAKKLFGDESAIGKQLTVFWSSTVKGVYKDFPANSLLKNCIYTPMNKDENKNSYNNWNYNTYLRLDAAEAKADVIEALLRVSHDLLKEVEDMPENATLQLTSLPDLHFTTDVQYDATPKSSRQTMLVLFSIAFAIIAIAGINFTNFSMALVPRRIRSINTQKILGASVGKLRVVLAAEAILTCLSAYFIALALVWLASKAPSITGLVDGGIRLSEYPRLLGATALLAILTGCVSGFYPAFYITSFQPALALKGSFGLSLQGRRIRNLLMGVQFTASMVLIMSAFFMYLQNNYMRNMPLGFEKDQIITTTLSGYIKKNYSVFENELKSFAGIEEVTYAQSLLGSQDQYMGWGRKYNDKEIQFQCLPVHPSFLKTMGIKLNEGRDFREDDRLGRHGKYIFNEKARKEYDIQLNTYIDSSEIVGFIPDIQFTTFHTTPTPMAFYVWGSENWGDQMSFAHIKVNAGSNLREAAEHVKKTLSKIDPEWDFSVLFFDDVINRVYQKEQRLTFLITSFSLIAILISIIGVFGLIVFETAYRRKEISIRKVHGSSVVEILSLFNRIYLILSGVCFLIACPVTYYAISKWLENFAFKTPMYWWIFLSGGLIILFITMLTVSSQSYRAATQNPTKALNME